MALLQHQEATHVRADPQQVGPHIGRQRRFPAPQPRGRAGHPARRTSRGPARRHRRAGPHRPGRTHRPAGGQAPFRSARPARRTERGVPGGPAPPGARAHAAGPWWWRRPAPTPPSRSWRPRPWTRTPRPWPPPPRPPSWSARPDGPGPRVAKTRGPGATHLRGRGRMGRERARPDAEPSAAPHAKVVKVVRARCRRRMDVRSDTGYDHAGEGLLEEAAPGTMRGLRVPCRGGPSAPQVRADAEGTRPRSRDVVSPGAGPARGTRPTAPSACGRRRC